MLNPRAANQEIAKTGGRLVLLNDVDRIVETEVDKQREHLGRFRHCTMIESFLTDLEFYTCEKIKQADAVTACVAWFTNRKIIETLANIPCRVAVQKEDWLRKDGNLSWTDQQKRERYKRMKKIPLEELYRQDPLPLPVETCTEYEDEAVRCVGHAQDILGTREGRSLMHHKFYVFYRRYPNNVLVPYAVMTGSANSTANMTNSVENMLYLECPELARRYHYEFLYIYGLSVPSQSASSNPTFVFDCAQIPRYSSYFSR